MFRLRASRARLVVGDAQVRAAALALDQVDRCRAAGSPSSNTASGSTLRGSLARDRAAGRTPARSAIGSHCAGRRRLLEPHAQVRAHRLHLVLPDALDRRRQLFPILLGHAIERAIQRRPRRVREPGASGRRPSAASARIASACTWWNRWPRVSGSSSSMDATSGARLPAGGSRRGRTDTGTPRSSAAPRASRRARRAGEAASDRPRAVGSPRTSPSAGVNLRCQRAHRVRSERARWSFSSKR